MHIVAPRDCKPDSSAENGRDREGGMTDSHYTHTEIIEDLQSALEELQAISDDLAQTPGAQEGEASG
jgi:hypothetical protein